MDLDTSEIIARADAQWAERKATVPAELLYDPCGCTTLEGHAEGQAIQANMRRDFRIAASACVGCYMGDDGPSIHDFGYGCQYGKGAS